MSSSTRSKKPDAGDGTSAFAKDLRDVGEAARRMASDSAEAVRETAREYIDEGRTRLRHLGESAQTRIHDQPVKSLLIAGAVGFLLGVFFARR